ncbi:MAG TPA: ferritin-like domain-containing protein [Gammaproteobacteria bacterium]|nr:ferritin-like domain-containing protein [Gammaproteobacteria bacterium]
MPDTEHNPAGNNLFARARQCLDCADPETKCKLTDLAVDDLNAGRLDLRNMDQPQPIAAPGRPPRPELIAPRDLPRRRPGSVAGRAALLHAVVHIEFNAINLAWDAVYRFRDMPEAFYRDWARVAREEAYHFHLLCERLAALGYAYGDFPAHDGLWEMACRTAHDPLVRMALVPRVLEARGLDVTPDMIRRLEQAGDVEVVRVLEIILRDEIGHVEIGTRWYRYLCEQRNIEPDATFEALVVEYMPGQVKTPFHYAARQQAGFNAAEMASLERLAATKR